MSRITDDRYSIADDGEALLSEWLNRALYDTHTAQPAEVVNFDKDNGSVDVRLGVMRDIKGQPQSVHLLTGLPVCYPVSGKYKIQFPVEVGSTGLVVFCESSIDTWVENVDDKNIAMNPQDTRMHDYSDGVFILGMRQYAKVQGIDSENMIIEADKTKITLSPSGKFSIEANGISFDQTILDALNKINLSPAVSGVVAEEIAKLQLMRL